MKCGSRRGGFANPKTLATALGEDRSVNRPHMGLAVQRVLSVPRKNISFVLHLANMTRLSQMIVAPSPLSGYQ